MRRRRIVWGGLIGLVALGAAAWVVYGGGRHQSAGTPLGARRSIAPSPAPSDAPQILFGDLHVHTTFSTDAYMRSLPLLNGEGLHPPADACDYARFCSALDFFALTDHAEAMTPAHWRESKEAIRACNAAAGDARSPDLVAFMGFEWSQVGATPEAHWGHRNVIFRDTDEEHLPARPIGAPGLVGAAMQGFGGLSVPTLLSIPLRDFANRQAYADVVRFQREARAVKPCPDGVPERALPVECRETAASPKELFARLDDWGFDALVIPHGTTWGFYTPPGYSIEKSLAAEQQHDRQRLLEIYSGHGNSEEYRGYREVERAPDGALVCPAPTPSYEPCCHRAGELVRARCGDAPAAECERRVAEARRLYLEGGAAGRYTIPGTRAEDWGDCGQCRDCFQPAFSMRPRGSAQYALATGEARFGFIASSDNHSARPGTGYKELARTRLTDVAGARDEGWRRTLFGEDEIPAPTARPMTVDTLRSLPPFRVLDLERQASFFLTGGLVAVQARGRDRAAIWEALRSRRVYATSGEKILLSFDLENGPGGAAAPMGADIRLTTKETPRFAVRAFGAFTQRPGCGPSALPAERVARLCLGECDHPSDTRKAVTRVEVVRIIPRRSPSEPVDGLIEDPWRTLPCPAGDPNAGCAVRFEDPEAAARGRDVLYYVRAIEAPSPAVNGGGLRCEKRDASGACLRARPCFGDYRTPAGDDCAAPVEERAWSSPIFVSFGGAR